MTATSPATAPRSRWSRPPSSDSRSSPRVSRPEPGRVAQPRAVNRGAALTGALLATLETPATWPLALAAFLVRGGLVLVVVPIVVLPTPVGIGNVFAPALGSIAFGSVSTGLVVVSVAAALAVVAWIVLGGWLAAALEAEAAGSSLATRRAAIAAPDRAGSPARPAAPGRGPDPGGPAGRVTSRWPSSWRPARSGSSSSPTAS